MLWNLKNKDQNFWFGWGGLAVGVVGIVLTIFIYFYTQKSGVISYSVQTQKIFDPNNLQRFKLLSPDGSTVDQSVFASELVLWNWRPQRLR